MTSHFLVQSEHFAEQPRLECHSYQCVGRRWLRGRACDGSCSDGGDAAGLLSLPQLRFFRVADAGKLARNDRLRPLSRG